MNKCHDEVNNLKEEEEKIRHQIQELKVEIQGLQKMQNQTSELPEDIELKRLISEYESLYKEKEEQDEQLDTLRQKNKELEEARMQNEKDIEKQIDDIENTRRLITETDQKVVDKETQKKDLEGKTTELRKSIQEQRGKMKVQEEVYLQAKESNKQYKQTLEKIQTSIADKNIHIRDCENQKSELEKKIKEHHNTLNNQRNAMDEKQTKHLKILAEI